MCWVVAEETPWGVGSGAKTQPGPVRTGANSFRSDAYAYSVDLADPSWRAWPAHSRLIPEADYGASSTQDCHLAVVPVYLEGHSPSQDALMRALFKAVHMDPNLARRRGLVVTKQVDGVEYEMEQAARGTTNCFLIQVLQDSGCAYWVSAWCPNEKADAKSHLTDALRKVEFRQPSSPPPSMTKLSWIQRQVQENSLRELAAAQIQSNQSAPRNSRERADAQSVRQ
jgi:hypothetical protein